MRGLWVLLIALPIPSAALARDAALGAKASCSAGQMISKDTAGRCCWPGQVWNGSACAGVPAACPDGYFASPLTQTCELPACGGGTERASDAVHCCWVGQEWEFLDHKCKGPPAACPVGWVPDGESCADADAKKAALQEEQKQAAAHDKAARDAASDPETKRKAAAAVKRCEQHCDDESAQRDETRCDERKTGGDCKPDGFWEAQQRSRVAACYLACHP